MLCIGLRRLTYNSVEQRGTECASLGTPSWRGVQGEPFPFRASSRTPTIPKRCMYDAYGVHHLAVSLRRFTDARAPRTPVLGHEFLNKFIRSSRRIDALAAKSDAVTAWKYTITDAYRLLPTLTGADSRCGAFAPFACDRVFPYPSVTGL